MEIVSNMLTSSALMKYDINKYGVIFDIRFAYAI